MLLLRVYGHLDEERQVEDSIISHDKIVKEATGKSRLEMNLHCFDFTEDKEIKKKKKRCRTSKCNLLKDRRIYMEMLYIHKALGDNYTFSRKFQFLFAFERK